MKPFSNYSTTILTLSISKVAAADEVDVYLKAMNKSTPAIIAKQNGEVVGYALATNRSLMSQHSLLSDLSSKINKISFGGKTVLFKK